MHEHNVITTRIVITTRPTHRRPIDEFLSQQSSMAMRAGESEATSRHVSPLVIWADYRRMLLSSSKEPPPSGDTALSKSPDPGVRLSPNGNVKNPSAALKEVESPPAVTVGDWPKNRCERGTLFSFHV